jgi:hypothetical protein
MWDACTIPAAGNLSPDQRASMAPVLARIDARFARLGTTMPDPTFGPDAQFQSIYNVGSRIDDAMQEGTFRDGSYRDGYKEVVGLATRACFLRAGIYEGAERLPHDLSEVGLDPALAAPVEAKVKARSRAKEVTRATLALVEKIEAALAAPPQTAGQ